MKSQDPEAVVEAIRTVLDGDLHVQPRLRNVLLRRLPENSDDGNPLRRRSDREFEVYHLVGSGMTARAIAKALHISPRTVETHRANIKEKTRAAHGA